MQGGSGGTNQNPYGRKLEPGEQPPDDPNLMVVRDPHARRPDENPPVTSGSNAPGGTGGTDAGTQGAGELPIGRQAPLFGGDPWEGTKGGVFEVVGWFMNPNCSFNCTSPGGNPFDGPGWSGGPVSGGPETPPGRDIGFTESHTFFRPDLDFIIGFPDTIDSLTRQLNGPVVQIPGDKK